MAESRKAEVQAERRIKLRSIKNSWDTVYITLSAFFLSLKQQFNQEVSEGAFLNDGSIYDSTGILSVRALTSAVSGATWKGASKTFRLAKPYFLPDRKDIRDYYAYVSMQLWQAFDNPNANFVSSYNEELEEYFVYGTAALAMLEGDSIQDPFRFQSRTLMNFCIARGLRGDIDTFYYDFKLTVKEAVQTYGLDKLSEATREKYAKGLLDDKVTFCEAIEPRSLDERIIPGQERFEYKKGKLGYPIRSVVFELTDDHLVEESGYQSMPVYVARCLVLPSETYGRSYAMDALPAVVQLNAITEYMMHGSEMKVMPALWASNNASVSGGMIDLSSGAVNMFDFMAAGTQAPISPIFDVGELQSIYNFYTSVRDAVLQHFFIDKLYDFNNESRMTLGEAEMRMMIRGDALTPIYTNLEKQLTWMIERGTNLLFPHGLLGVAKEDVEKQESLRAKGIEPMIIPDEVLALMKSGMDWYKVNYISPAHRSMRAEELKGTMDMANVFLAVAKGGKPEILDRWDVDALADLLPELTGGDERLIRSLEEAQADRAVRQQVQQMQLQVEMEKIKAQANQSNAQAAASMKNAQAMSQSMAAGESVGPEGVSMTEDQSALAGI